MGTGSAARPAGRGAGAGHEPGGDEVVERRGAAARARPGRAWPPAVRRRSPRPARRPRPGARARPGRPRSSRIPIARRHVYTQCTHHGLATRPTGRHDTGAHELRLHRGAGRAAQDRPRVPRGQEPRDRGPRADGDRERLRPGRLERRWASSWACRACTSPRSSAARATATSSSASCSRRWAAPCCARRTSPPSCSPPTRCCTRGDDAAKKELPARHRQRRDHRHAGVHRAVAASGTRRASRCRPPAVRRRLHAQRHEDVRARRPHRRPDHRRRPHRQRRQPVRRRRRRRRPHPHARCRRWTRPASRPSSSSPTRRPR